MKLVDILNYTMISNHRMSCKGSGTAIFVRNVIPFKTQKDLNIFHKKIIESIFVKISAKNGKKIIVGSLYHPPNNVPSEFTTKLNELTSKVKLEKNKELILGMDDNLDLLKSGTHKPTQVFLEDLLNKNKLPTITRPTKITQNSTTLIDNIFVSEKLHHFFESAVIITDISNHLPSLSLLKQTKLLDQKLLEFGSHNLSQAKIKTIKTKLLQVDWTNVLNSTSSNENFDKFLPKVNNIMDKISPAKMIRISVKGRYIEPWMKQGLEILSRKKQKLYRAYLMTNSIPEDRERYLNYCNTYNKTKRALKKSYYLTRANYFANDSKNLWQLLNQVICKTKNRGSIIPYISIDSLRTYNPTKIANAFKTFYSNLGKDLASKIKPGLQDIDQYLRYILRNTHSLMMRFTNEWEIETIIDQLPNKTSHGHDKISNVLLKQLSKSISYPLCMIFNNSLMEGKFPTQMKKAVVIPLYKGKEFDLVINYHPISLLITTSKVLEKVVYKRVYRFLEKQIYYIKVNMAFEQSTLVNKP